MNAHTKRKVAVHAHLSQALDMLNELIAQGIEFPEAEYRTLFEYPHISRPQLLDAYDTQERGQ